MKAITCPQCGGLIKNFLPRQPIVECDYCGAQVIADERFPMLESFDDEAAKFRALAAPLVRSRSPVQPIFIAISGIGVFMFVMFLIAFIPAKSKPAAPLAPEPFKPIIFPQFVAPTVEKSGKYDDAAIISSDKGIGRVVVPKRTKRRLR